MAKEVDNYVSPMARELFLRGLAHGCGPHYSARAAGHPLQVFYDLQQAEPDFAVDCYDAAGGSIKDIEAKAIEIAANGSVQMLQFMLSAAFPERYCPRVRALKWQEGAAERARLKQTTADDEVIEGLFRVLDDLEASKIAEGTAATDPLLA